MMRNPNSPPRPAHGQASLSVPPACHGIGRGFTLTEMLVALAVMVLALAMVTSVFSVTTKTAATSAAIADVEAVVSNFADHLQQDLEWCDPSQSILVIHGRTQAAALTEDLRQAGQYYRVMTGDPGLVDATQDPRFTATPPPQYSDPRADILMFFTNRPTASKAPATSTTLVPGSFQEKLQRGAEVSPIQVVYGHAALDTAVQVGSVWQFAGALQHIETDSPTVLSPLPAARWQLARRATALDPNTAGLDPRNGFVNTYGGEQETARIVRCYSTNANFAGDAAHLNLSDYLSLFAPGINQWDGTAHNLALWSPYQVACAAGYAGLPPPHGSLRWSATESGWVYNVLYPGGVENDHRHHVATVIEQPPAALADNLGVQLAPGCVWFQVEFLLPEDPRNGLDHPLSDQRRDTPRWVPVQPGQTYVFVPDSQENRDLVRSQIVGGGLLPDQPVSPSRLQTFAQVVPPSGTTPPVNYAGLNTLRNREVRLWPYAIRATIRVIDQRGRLEEPIVRSVVHRFD
jgi:prepilin-type N-terminal cleavage/methylation domain-containing protein